MFGFCAGFCTRARPQTQEPAFRVNIYIMIFIVKGIYFALQLYIEYCSPLLIGGGGRGVE